MISGKVAPSFRLSIRWTLADLVGRDFIERVIG